MTYNKEEDILGMYKFKCMYCRVKFLDKPSLKIHLRMIHAYIANEFDLKPSQNTIIRSIQRLRKGV